MNNTEKLTKSLQKVADIHGVSIGHADDKSTWRIDFKDEATQEQKNLAMSMLAAYVPMSAQQLKALDDAALFLRTTDADVLLYLEEVAAGSKTTLSTEEYLALAIKRQQARDSIKGE